MTANDRLGDLAKRLREQAGLTQVDLCVQASERGFPLKQTVYSGLERGARTWNAKYIDAVAAGLGEDPAVFLAQPEGPVARVERLARDFLDAVADALRTPGVVG